MSRDKQTEIQQFAIDLQNVSAKVSNIIMEETHEFVSQNHKYNSLKEFHEAHKKGRNVMEAEFLTELGYAKASEVVLEAFEWLEEKGFLNIEVWAIQDVKDELKKKYESEKENG